MSLSYHIEYFTNEEKAILNKFFTNTDKPVFGLINMPEVVKGALYARYSRSTKSLRRLFLDEFYKETNGQIVLNQDENTNSGVNRASQLFDKVFVEYGDDSVAQLGGAHLACEQSSNILAKILERGRLAAYLEQSTRYVYYNQKIDGRYKYVTPAEIINAGLQKEYESTVDNLFDAYTEIVEKLIPKFKQIFPQNSDQSIRAWEATLNAKACDIVRGLLPASTRTNIGIYATGQAYEMLLMRMFASNNNEVIEYAKLMLEELRKIIPAFLKRVDLEERGKLWSTYLKQIDQNMDKVSLIEKDNSNKGNILNKIELLDWDRNAVDKVIAAALFEYSELSYEDLHTYAKSLPLDEKRRILQSYFGERKNRRHKPGRALETTFYTFDILSDYGAFRDLQRHRMLTIEWQKLNPKHGYNIPEELNEFPEEREIYIKAIEKAGEFYYSIDKINPVVAQYVMPFAYNIRYLFNINLREAIHLIELRTQKQGHISYRNVCMEMYRQIEQKTDHGLLLDCMKYVDFSSYTLSREDAETKLDKRN